ncbi:YGR016W [Zygosaccharomyces parabailii]|nr:YGR016W [Zygosaccharomyces parabailii]
MPELKRLHRSAIASSAFKDDDEDFPMQPMDTEEQEELIQKLEKANTSRNSCYMNILTTLYVISGLLFLLLIQRGHGKEYFLYTMGFFSITLSVTSLRYETATDYRMFTVSQVYVNNYVVRTSNVILLVLVEWLAFATSNLKGLSQLPFLLFIVSILMRRWSKSMESELSSLRSMKYKYKNA